MNREGFLPYTIVAVVGGLLGYGVHLAAHQVYGFRGSIIAPITFFLALQMGFAVWWRRRTIPHARATPGVVYAVALTAAAVPIALLAWMAAQIGLSIEETPGEPMILPFLREVAPYFLVFSLLMAPASWLVWLLTAKGQR